MTPEWSKGRRRSRGDTLLALLVGPETDRPIRKLVLQFLFWTALAAITTADQLLTLTVNHRDFDWRPIVLSNTGNWYLWALESIAIIRFAQRFPLDQGRWKRNIAWHVLAGAVAAVVMSCTGYPFSRWVNPDSAESYWHYLAVHFGFDFLLYWITAGVAYAFEYQRRFRERELRASQLEGALARAQLDVLRMQLNPHFLFNALNAVSALVHRDPDAADRMIARLGELLRASMEREAAHVLPLRQELDLLQRYLDIMQVRFQDRLRVDLDIDAETLDLPVPNLILQPLVENAIRHAISPRAEGGRVAITSRIRGDQLELAIEDDGPGLDTPAEDALQAGLGLSNTRARLEALYGPEPRLWLETIQEADGRTDSPSLVRGLGRGLRVRVHIPRAGQIPDASKSPYVRTESNGRIDSKRPSENAEPFENKHPIERNGPSDGNRPIDSNGQSENRRPIESSTHANALVHRRSNGRRS